MLSAKDFPSWNYWGFLRVTLLIRRLKFFQILHHWGLILWWYYRNNSGEQGFKKFWALWSSSSMIPLKALLCPRTALLNFVLNEDSAFRKLYRLENIICRDATIQPVIIFTIYIYPKSFFSNAVICTLRVSDWFTETNCFVYHISQLFVFLIMIVFCLFSSMYTIKDYQINNSDGRRGLCSLIFLALAETYDIVLNIFHLFLRNQKVVPASCFTL